MANLHQIYSDVTGRTELAIKRNERRQQVEGIQVSPAENATRAQAKIDWLQSPITSEIFSAIADEIQLLEDGARKAACSYSTHLNHMGIINNLVRSSELRKIIEKYGKTN